MAKKYEAAKKYYVCEYKPVLPASTSPKAYKSVEKATDAAVDFFIRNLQAAAKPIRRGDINCYEVPEKEAMEYEMFFEKR